MEKDIKRKIEKELIAEYERWNHLYTYGGNDPFFTDGCNLNLVRNHIISYRMQLEELSYAPEVYYRELPPEIDDSYMARKEEIRERAQNTLTLLLSNEDYQFLLKNKNSITEKDSQQIGLQNVLGYVKRFQAYLNEDNLCQLRRYAQDTIYTSSFTLCREKMELLLQNNVLKPEFLEENTGQLRFA